MVRSIVTIYQRQLESLVAELGITGASFAYWDGETTRLRTAGLRNDCDDSRSGRLASNYRPARRGVFSVLR